ncbi:TonB-dependent receptor plug domain-containing protein [Hymenobacter rubripertinctus]|uniref:TonB-dependent receptor plug domain-containing protein n=1 Tax=Hymenobacter rubripertinctus TaxID=2029981 RepID=A0A418QY22_9BACT|nr:TonB-dependent receptor plug domain-containing protein [Hymenobacter rubripertinctus]RIY10065.1 hypothetical protein D0T11_11035 [Hymenobacter rubripertinctus]
MLYVDVVTPEREVIFQRTLALEHGMVAGDIILPDTLRTGVYTLRAYTSWMRNSAEDLFFTRRVPVWQVAAPAAAGPAASDARRALRARATAQQLKAASAPDVQFFPEGGDYLAGLPTTVGVKAVTASGHGLALQGTVLDEKGNAVARFTTPALGTSSFNFTPLANQRYRATVTLPEGTAATYALPAVREAGWLLNVREIGDNYRVFVRHQGAGAATPEPLQLVAHVRGQPVYSGTGLIAPGETFSAVIPKANAPAGILHITLFDGRQTAQAERLVFVPETQGLQVRLRPSKQTYGRREAVGLDVEVTTAAGQPVAAELSLAVSNTVVLPGAAAEATDVRAHLLLTSELRGYVENPAYYFQAHTPAVQRALNDLLLTQGWSRFTWQQVQAPTSLAAGYLFPLERTLMLSGQLVRNNKKPVPEGQITLLYGKTKNLVQATAGPGGMFLFTGFPGQDTTAVLLQARTPKGSNNVLLQLNELWPRPADSWRPVVPLSLATAESAPVVAYGQRSRRQQQQLYRPDSTSGIVLRNVTVTGRKAPDSPPSLHSGNVSALLRTRDFPTIGSYRNIFEFMQGRVTGMQVTTTTTGYSVLIRGMSSFKGSTEPLYLLDGMTLSDGDALLAIPAVDVERIEVLKGAAAAMYGSRGGNGVVAVYTKRNSGDFSTTPAAGVAVRRVPAYHRTREFYAPATKPAAGPTRPTPAPRPSIGSPT